MHIDLKAELKRNPAAGAGMAAVGAMAVLALAAPLITFHDPLEQTRLAFEAPSASHWLGTNHVGQDLWAQLIYGARTSLLVGFVSAIIATILATAVGASAALVGGKFDRIVMRLVDGLIIVPMIIVVILVAAYLEPGLWSLILLLSFFGWPWGARIIRAQTLSLKERPHVAAARGFGAGRFYLIRNHILPDLGPILAVELVYGIRRGIFMEAGLAFLGISDPNNLSWGVMMHDALMYCYLDAWRWWLIPPGIALSLTIVAVTFIGRGIEPVLDPRLREEAHAAD